MVVDRWPKSNVLRDRRPEHGSKGQWDCEEKHIYPYVDIWIYVYMYFHFCLGFVFISLRNGDLI